MYASGEGIPQNYEKAFYWGKKAAEQGNANAQYNIAGSYYKGQGVEQDYEKAVYWFKKAAKQNNEYVNKSIAEICKTNKELCKAITE